jgi:hypothetical protein
MKIFCILFTSVLFFTLKVNAQVRRITEAKYCNTNIKIDGELSESIWSDTKTETNFVQTLPNPDKPSNYKTEVKIVYTQTSIIVGAKCYQPIAESSKQMATRDQLGNSNSDVFSVTFDTYDDHQNGFAFRVSIVGVQQDERLSGGDLDGDNSWDAVWQSKTKIENDYWIAEMEIPFSALRFGNNAEKKWGLNFQRLVRKKNEQSFWNPINVQKAGFLAQTGQLVGLDNIKPPVRLFLFPYVSTGYYNNQQASGIQKQFLRSGGMDIKYGLNESFTLDMTLVPDFSQVISDNLIRNLSPFEQQLSENRPFFTEGTELFNKDDLFYTRRIGDRPSKFYDVESNYGDTSKYTIKKNPRISTLINAFKISGRTKNKVGIGIFNAVGAPMYAKVYDKQLQTNLPKINTEPLTNYNVLVIDKALKGQSSITFTNSNVIRKGEARDGNVSSVLVSMFDKSETYKAFAATKMSVVNETLNVSAGTSIEAGFAKVSGKLNYKIGLQRISKNYDKTDLGLQYDFNHSAEYLEWIYGNNKLKSTHFQLYRFGQNISVTHNTLPVKLKRFETNFYFFLLLKNFWDITYYTELVPNRPLDFYQLGGFNKLLITYPYWYNGINGSSDSRKKLFWYYEFGYGFSNNKHADYAEANQSVRYRFNSKFEMSVGANIKRDNSNIGYAYYDSKNKIPVIGRRDVREYSGQISMKYNVNPFMNFTARFRHYNSYLSYLTFHHVDVKGEWQSSLLPFNKSYDENYNLQNVDIFYNWIFRPGSRLVVSYKQWLNDAYIINERQRNNYFNNVGQIIKSPKAYEVAIRLIYFIDYNQVKRN